MKNYLFIFLLSLSFILSVSAQDKEAVKVDEFGIITCGDFMARMDGLFGEYQRYPETEIYVIYYGARYRKYYKYSDKREILKLDYPHRDDGLNWAKSIPLYLTTDSNYPETFRNSIKDKIKLIDGGFRENREVEIWLVPKGAELPKPVPLLDEKYIEFRKNKPYPVRNLTGCYDIYENS